MKFKLNKLTPSVLTRFCALAFVVFGLIAAPVFGQQFGPVLPFTTESTNGLLLEEALRDPAIVASMPSDNLYAQQIEAEIKELKVELSRAQKVRREEVLKELYVKHAQLVYFYMDVANSRRSSTIAPAQARTIASNLRNNMMSYATQFAKIIKQNSERAQAVYQVIAFQFVSGSGRSGALKQGEAIEKFLPAALKNRLALMRAIDEAERKGQPNKLAQAINAVNQDGKIAGRLILAKQTARKTKNSPAVANHLKAATQQATSLPETQRTQVLRNALGIWRSNAKAKDSWGQAPIARGYEASAEMRSVAERFALEQWNQKKEQNALKIYHHLAISYSGDPIVVTLDRRILDLEYELFKRNKNLKAYETALIKTVGKYRQEAYLGKNDEGKRKAALDEFNVRYRNLVYSSLKLAKKSEAKANLRVQIIGVAQNYQTNFAQDQEKEFIQSEIAAAYAVNKQHDKAVELYMDLVLNKKSNNAKNYLLLAIISQRELASWPAVAPWGQAPAGDNEARGALLDMYNRLAQMNSKEFEWQITSHRGALMMTQGNPRGAFKLWQEGMQKQPQHPDAAKAAGYMMIAYSKAKEWQNLENMARLTMKLRIAASFQNQAVDPVKFLADALFNGAKELLAASKFKESVKKFEEFIKVYPKESRRDEGMFLLAHAYRGDERHPESITMMMNLVREYPQTKRLRDALLKGGDWSTAVAFEDEAMFFYASFVQKFPADPKTKETRRTLTALYLGRSQFGSASALYWQQSQDSRESREDQIAAAVAFTDIEYRYGDIATALSGANLIMKISGQNPSALAQAQIIFARAAQQASKHDKVAAIEQTVSGYDPTQQEVIETLSEIRLMLAENFAEKTKDEVFNLGLKDPVMTLNKHYSFFSQAKGFYEKVCDAGPSSLCAPAMFRLAQVAQESLTVLRDLSIADTLGQNEIDTFNKRKDSIVTFLSEIAQQSDAKALALTKDSQTIPLWVAQILWTNSNDWNFDRVSGESGNGYVQWKNALPSNPGKVQSEDISSDNDAVSDANDAE